MNAAVKVQSCPGEEVLAAFIDQRLAPASRLEVVKHLAECGECRDIVVATNEYQTAEGAEGGEVVRGRFGTRWVAPLVAAAAVVAVIFGVPSIRERTFPRDPMTQLVEAANGLPKRPVEGRLSAHFAYKDYIALRGRHETNPELAILAAAAEIAERVEDKPAPSAKDLHSYGVANMLLKNDVDAVRFLELAANANPESAAILADLSAAYISRGDYEKALQAATRAWELGETPAAAWNRALALQWLDRRAEAVAAWKKYLELDPNSEWTVEAAKNLRDLQTP